VGFDREKRKSPGEVYRCLKDLGDDEKKLEEYGNPKPAVEIRKLL